MVKIIPATKGQLKARDAAQTSYINKIDAQKRRNKINKMMAEKYGAFKYSKIKVGL